MESYAWEEARDLFSRAIALREGKDEDEQAADLYFGLGQAQSALLDAGADDSCSRAFDLYRKLGRVDRAIAVAGLGLYCTPKQWPGRVAMADKALAMVEKGSREEPIVITMHASMTTSMSAEERQRQLEYALDLARRKGVTSMQMWIMMRLSYANMNNADYKACGEWASQAYQLAVREGDLAGQCAALLQLNEMNRVMGTATTTMLGRDAETFLSVAEKLRDRIHLWGALLACTRIAWARADWPRAKELNDRLKSLLPSDFSSVHLLHRALFEYHTRRFDAGDRELENAFQIAERTPHSWDIILLFVFYVPRANHEACA